LLYFSTSVQDISRLKKIPCYCPICQKNNGNPELYQLNDILFHNYFMLENELNLINQAIEQKTLRNYINLRISNNPHLTSIIRLFEMDKNHILENYTPRYKPSIIQATGIEDFHRPEIKRFQKQMCTKYTKPENTNVLLLLPCSAKKPYSFSKSHKNYLKVIQSVPNHHCIHELIITSPLGIVPRELELMYPASSYEIPVTGHWFEDEKQMIKSLIELYLNRNQYDKIIVHLPDPLNTFLMNNFQSMISTGATTSPTSKESIEKLLTTLKNETTDIEQISPSIRIKDNIFSIVAFQFSIDIASDLLNRTIIKGKYPFLKIFDKKNKQLGMLTEPRGMISLTLEGADRVKTHRMFYVNISNEFTLKGSVFAPGVLNADPRIRKGDEVLVFQNDQLLAVGVAQMSGSEMGQRVSGKAVDVRHKK
jgi:archaeosine synthase